MAFVHLHNHTQYSLLDGACRVDKMANLAKGLGMPAVAMTDHGNMFGAIDFYNTCKKIGIKPIVGIEAYIIPGEFSDHDSKKQKRHHLVLLAKNITGYRNLCKLSSRSFTEGFYFKPRITKSMLREHSEGLICLSACIQGEIPSLLFDNRDKAAREALVEYKEIFGKDFYLELQDHGISKEREVMPKLIELARATDTPMVVTNDCHYLQKEDEEAHSILLCIQTGHKESDENRMRYATDQLYFKTEEEMRELFPDLGEAYDNTVKIAEQIDLKLDYNSFIFPRMEIPSEYEDSREYLKALCYDAVPKRYKELTPEIQKRLDYELSVINEKGFPDYFLIVQDFIKASRDQGIPVGPGRGSAAGSIVAYLLEITQLDPLKYKLLFERFLNLSRTEMPDIDIDIDSEYRDRVIDYVVNKYGRESVCQIVTFGELKPKSVIKDVSRVLEISVSEANKMSKLIPDGPKMTLEMAYQESPGFRAMIDSCGLYQRVFRIAKVLEGLIRQTGIHAAGVVIGPGDLSDFVPLSTTPAKKGGERITLVQYEGKWLDALKLLKMDFLGLKTLTLIRKTQKLIKENHGIDLDVDNLELDDEETYELLSKAETDGVFQLESPGMKKYLKKLKPNMFDDIIAMVALYRPGPMQFIDTYINRKHGREEIAYTHPVMEKSLKDTYGVTVYQEQVMQISKDLALFDSKEAGILRKVISKKKKDKMDEMYTQFRDGALKNNVKEEIITKVWDEFTSFAQYAFNKSHAACYALISYQTAYLKAHYPVEFMAALMSEEKDPSKIPSQIEVSKQMGIEVIPPNINLCEVDFAARDGKILYGLKGIKNVGAGAVEKLTIERVKNGKYTDLWDFCRRLGTSVLNKSILESLIAAGAFDDLPGSRSQNYESVQIALDFAASEQKDFDRGQLTLFEEFAEDVEESVKPQFPEVPEWSFNERLEKEKDVLGFYYSGHPLDRFKTQIKGIINFEANQYKDKESNNGIEVKIPTDINMCALVNKVELKQSKKRKTPFAVLRLEDFTGKFEAVLFNEQYDKYISWLKPGKMLLMSGRDNSKDSKLFNLMPDKIIDLEKFDEEVSGILYIAVDEKQINEDFCAVIDNYSDDKNQIELRLIIETAKFEKLICKTGRKVTLEEKFLKAIKELTGCQPRFKLE